MNSFKPFVSASIYLFGLFCFCCGIVVGCSKNDTAVAAEDKLPLEKPDAIVAPNPPQPPQPPPKPQYIWGNIPIDEIEGCEYVKWGFNDGNFTYIHKGNCKACQARMTAAISDAIAKTSFSLPADSQPNHASITNFYKTFTKDGCEYAVCYGAAISYTHIGTCTNCWHRMEQMIRTIVKEELHNGR
jgi:hypothetical protein